MGFYNVGVRAKRAGSGTPSRQVDCKKKKYFLMAENRVFSRPTKNLTRKLRMHNWGGDPFSLTEEL